MFCSRISRTFSVRQQSTQLPVKHQHGVETRLPPQQQTIEYLLTLETQPEMLTVFVPGPATPLPLQNQEEAICLDGCEPLTPITSVTSYVPQTHKAIHNNILAAGTPWLLGSGTCTLEAWAAP